MHPQRNALVFWPYNPVPATSGAHHAELADAQALQALGYRLFVFGSDTSSDNPWNESAATHLQWKYHVASRAYRGGVVDQLFGNHQARSSAASWSRYVTPWMLDHFRDTVRSIEPDLVVIYYAYWGALAEAVPPNVPKVLRSLDVLSLNSAMLDALTPELPLPADPRQSSLACLDETFFDQRLARRPPSFQEEIASAERFEALAAFTVQDQQTLGSLIPRTRVGYVPFATPVQAIANRYDGAPLFVISNYLLNLQGYLYFAARVLPHVLRSIPRFQLGVIGRACDRAVAVPGIRFLGFQPSLEGLYEQAPFALCPLIGGTGMQIKIVEAMAHGVPVIALRNVAGSSPIEHGVNGLVASNACEFAECTVRLAHDRRLCARLGAAARETIQARLSPQKLIGHWQQLLDPEATPACRLPILDAEPGAPPIDGLEVPVSFRDTIAPEALFRRILDAEDPELAVQQNADRLTDELVELVSRTAGRAAAAGNLPLKQGLDQLRRTIQLQMSRQTPALCPAAL